MDSRIRLHEGRRFVGGRGWVPASVFEDNGWGRGFPHPSSWGQALRGGTGMGPRIREDNGGRLFAGTTEAGDGFPHPRTTEGALRGNNGRRCGWGEGWVPASVFTGASSRWEDTGGCTPILTFPPEGGRERGGGGFPPFLRRWALRGNDVDGRERGKGWVPAYARTTGGGEGGRMMGWVALRVGGGMGFRIRLHEGRLSGEDGDGSPHTRGQRKGEREEGWWTGFPSVFAGGALRGNNGGGRGGGMGSRIRLHGGSSPWGTRGWVPASAKGKGRGVGSPAGALRGTTDGGEGGRMGLVALQGDLRGNNGGGGGGGGWVPASVFMVGRLRRTTTGGGMGASARGWGVGSRIRLHGGELSVGGHGRVHPHPNLPP